MRRQDGFAVTMDEELLGWNAEWRRRRDSIKKLSTIYAYSRREMLFA